MSKGSVASPSRSCEYPIEAELRALDPVAMGDRLTPDRERDRHHDDRDDDRPHRCPLFALRRRHPGTGGAPGSSRSAPGCGPKAGSTAAGILYRCCHEQDRPRRAALPALRHPSVPPRRHRQGARPGGGRESGAGSGVPGRRDPPSERRPARDLHGPQDLLRRRRRADLPGALAVDREARGRIARGRPSGEALLPAGTPGEEGADQGTPDRRGEARRDGGGGGRGDRARGRRGRCRGGRGRRCGDRGGLGGRRRRADRRDGPRGERGRVTESPVVADEADEAEEPADG